MGGTSTAVLDTFYAFYTPGAATAAGRRRPRLGGRPHAARRPDRVAFERPNTYGAGTGVTYDPEALKVLWERLAEDAGVDLLLHTWVTGARVRDGRVGARPTWNKGGERWVEAPPSSTPRRRGRVRDGRRARTTHRTTPGRSQSLSTLFTVANVDIARAVGRAQGGAVAR